MELSHKRARFELEKTASNRARDLEVRTPPSPPRSRRASMLQVCSRPLTSCSLSLQHELDRNQELLARIKKLEERESEMERNLSEKADANRALRKNLEALNKKLEDRDGRLSSANQVRRGGGPPARVSQLTLPSVRSSQTVSALKDEVRELKQKIQNQDSSICGQTLENQELQEQLELQRRYGRSPPLLCWCIHTSGVCSSSFRKYQDVSQLYQSLQAAQSTCSDHVLRIKVCTRGQEPGPSTAFTRLHLCTGDLRGQRSLSHASDNLK